MIKLRNVSKRFKLYRSPTDRLMEWCHLGRHHQEFYALRHVDLSVPEGRTVGIIGVNGAGKSTLLKLITGTLLPTEGSIEIRGRVAALLELGTGFHPEFTGRQNIHVNGQLLGLSADRIQELEPEIIAFSELGAFIDQPLRTYSSGMTVRLGFSIAASVQPEVLIIDEALSVGDARFSQKCIRRIREFRDRGTTILFVSHDPSAITMLCDEAVLLEAGRVVGQGSPRDILDDYNALLAAKGSGNVEMRITRASRDDQPFALRRHGTFQALVSNLQLLRGEATPSDVYAPMEPMKLRFRVDFLTDVDSPTVGFLIKDRLGLALYGTNSALKAIPLGQFRAGDYTEVEVTIPLRLGYGDYSITVAVHNDETHLEKCYEWTDNAAVFRIRHADKPDWSGLVVLDPQITARRGQSSLTEIEKPLLERFGDIPDPLPLDSEPPSPLLSGFLPVRQGEQGAARPLAFNATFLFKPRGRMLCMRTALTAPAERLPLKLTLRIPNLGVEFSINQTQPQATLAFPLPPEAIGHAALYSIETGVTLLDADRTSLLDLYGISSTDQPQESPAWPTITPTR